MLEPRRRESSHAADPANAGDRDSQAEALLVDGLDQYFAGQFDQAIHLWTRVLFLDRSHARARAYIDRARTALGERQRRADEMLQASDELLAQGRTSAARDLLATAVATSGDDDRASALRLRLERLERAHAAALVGGGQRIVDVQPVRVWTRRSRSSAAAGALVMVAVAALLVVAGGRAGTTDWLGWNAATERLVIDTTPVMPPALSGADAAMVRARSLFARGRLGEALVALDRVGPEGPSRAAAEQLRIEIQEMLLASGPGVSRIIEPTETGRR